MTDLLFKMFDGTEQQIIGAVRVTEDGTLVSTGRAGGILSTVVLESKTQADIVAEIIRRFQNAPYLWAEPVKT